jgi:phosphate transport system protein
VRAVSEDHAVVDSTSTSKTSREIESLRELILRMGQLSEDILARSLKAVWQRDEKAAAQVAVDDLEIDRLELHIDQTVLRQLALRAPVAQDLRQVIAVKTMATDLERVGDLARNIAKCALRLIERDPIEPPPIMRSLASRCQQLLSLSLRSYADTDPVLARRVLSMDDEVDEEEDHAIQESIGRIRKSPDAAGQEIDLIFIAQSLERVADHATNIAEDVILVAESLNIKHAEKLSS